MSFPSDLEIAQKAHLQPIATVAARLGIDPDEIEPDSPADAMWTFHGTLPVSATETRVNLPCPSPA